MDGYMSQQNGNSQQQQFRQAEYPAGGFNYPGQNGTGLPSYNFGTGYGGSYNQQSNYFSSSGNQQNTQRVPQGNGGNGQQKSGLPTSTSSSTSSSVLSPVSTGYPNMQQSGNSSVSQQSGSGNSAQSGSGLPRYGTPTQNISNSPSMGSQVPTSGPVINEGRSNGGSNVPVPYEASVRQGSGSNGVYQAEYVPSQRGGTALESFSRLAAGGSQVKSAEALAKMIEGPMATVPDQKKLMLIMGLKKWPLTDKDAARGQASLDAARRGLGLVDGVPTINAEKIYNNSLKEALECLKIGNYLATYSNNVSWDHVAICLTPYISTLRKDNKRFVPPVQRFLYSKALFSPCDDANEIMAELWSRFKISALAVLGIQDLVLHGVTVETLDDWAKSLNNGNYFPRMAGIVNPELNAEMIKRHGSSRDPSDLVLLCESMFFIDVRYAGFSKFYKTRRGRAEADQLHETIHTFMMMYAYLADITCNGSYFKTMSDHEPSEDANSEYTSAYYNALKALRKFAVTVKTKLNGSTLSNERANRESLERSRVNQKKVQGRAIESLKQLGFDTTKTYADFGFHYVANPYNTKGDNTEQGFEIGKTPYDAQMLTAKKHGLEDFPMGSQDTPQKQEVKQQEPEKKEQQKEEKPEKSSDLDGLS